MRRYVKPATVIPSKAEAEQVAQDFDVVVQLEKAKEVVRREIQNLLIKSTSGKLDSASARDLVSYVDLLTKMQREEEKQVAGMSEDEIKKHIKE